ncbi:MAG: hypothetical protein M0015_07820 [Betaproteobacteria bacterium]|nr:hypothetical protein [Betaproteobacteria bacterium]
MLQRLIELRERTVYYVAGSRPAAYFIADVEAQGVLVNSPAFDPRLLQGLQALAPLKYVFLPSRRGALDLDRWRGASGAETLATEAEAPAIAGTIDLMLARGRKLTRTIDFLQMAGVTEGSCALRIRNNGGVLFFGPILEPGADGWPVLVPHADDHSAENRLLGALGLQDLRFEYAFTDVFEPGRTRFGPGADAAIRIRLQRLLEA